MPDIFINYRNGDEEGTATLIDKELADRFGRDQVFRASRSIRPGEDFAPALLTAVRGSKVLLAVIGSRWLTAVDKQGRNRLDNEDDWIRKEILEAFDHGVVVIPVLVGRRQPRLDPSDLPPDLARLARLQSCLLDTHSSERDLRWLGDMIVKLVPSLVDSDQPGELSGSDDGPASATSRAGDHARQRNGVTNTVVNNPQGPVHGGSGNQVNGDGVIYAEGDIRGGIRQSLRPARKPSDDR